MFFQFILHNFYFLLAAPVSGWLERMVRSFSDRGEHGVDR